MAARPTVGGSDGTWGTELNAHLDVSLDDDGKVDDGAAQTTSAAPGADAEIANKKYVDDQITAAIAAISPTIKVGTYTGNGATTQGITGVGFQPDGMFIVKHVDGNSHSMFVKTSGMGVNAYQVYLNGWYKSDHIISLDADGFTVGDGTGSANALNLSGIGYSYIAMKSN